MNADTADRQDAFVPAASGMNLDFCLFDSDGSDRRQKLGSILADSGRTLPIEVGS